MARGHPQCGQYLVDLSGEHRAPPVCRPTLMASLDTSNRMLAAVGYVYRNASTLYDWVGYRIV
jgi:hypothetical protein